MNSVLDLFHQRIFHLQIALQASNQISAHAQNNPSSSPSPSSRTNSAIIQPSLAHAFLPMHSNYSFAQMTTRAYELLAIFQSAFEQLDILSIDAAPSTPVKQPDSDCTPIALNLAGIWMMKEEEKFRYELEYFSQMLLSLFRALLLDSPSIENEQRSEQILALQTRLRESQARIVQLLHAKKDLPQEKSDQLIELRTVQAQLKDRLMEENARTKIARRYCQNWQTNHIQQWTQMLLQSEDDLHRTVRQYEHNLQQSEFVHQETVRMLVEQNNEKQSKASQWYEYYQSETSRFERELTDFRWQYNQLKARREELTGECEQMEAIVEEYNQMKVKEKLTLEKQKQEEEAARVLQTWWRGIMIRQKQKKKKKKKKK